MGEYGKEFREDIAQKAQEYDWVSMPFEEAVAKVLEQEGMKSEIGQNADARRKIAELVRKDGRMPDRINSGNIDYVRSVLKEFITRDGTIKSETKEMVEGADQPNVYTNVIDVRDGKLVLENSFYAPRGNYSEQTDTTIENGIEMQKVKTYNNSGNIITYTRNPDLVTMHVNMENKYEQSLNRGVDEWAVGEYPERLDGSAITIGSLEALKAEVAKIDEARKEGKTPNGYLYEGKDEVELKKLQESKERELKGLIEKNKEFKKMAEAKGLIQPENSQELE